VGTNGFRASKRLRYAQNVNLYTGRFRGVAMENKVTIYSLIDPDTLEVKYVGRTEKTLPQRLASHLTGRENIQKLKWIKKLRDKGKTPIIKELWNCSLESADRIELEYINSYGEKGVKLFNTFFKTAPIKKERVGYKKITLYMPEKLIEKLDKLSEKTGARKSELIRRAIKRFLSK